MHETETMLSSFRLRLPEFSRLPEQREAGSGARRAAAARTHHRLPRRVTRPAQPAGPKFSAAQGLSQHDLHLPEAFW